MSRSEPSPRPPERAGEEGATRSLIAMTVVITAVMFVDGYDVFMIGKIAPAVAEGVGSTPAAMTLVFLLQQIGLGVGSFVVSPIADRFGRKKSLIFCFIVFGLLTFATSFAQSIVQIAVLRGVAGLFLAAIVPMATALMSEVAPLGRRGSLIAIGVVGYSAGNAAGAGAAFLIPHVGWQGGFWVGGILPLLLVPFMARWLIEPRRVSQAPAPLAKSERRSATALVDEVAAPANLGPGSKFNILDIFADGRKVATLLFWASCFMSMGNIALIYSWLPTFFVEMAGVSLQDFAIVTMIAFFGGVVGTLGVGFLGDWLGIRRLIPLFYLGLAAAIFSIGQVPFASPYFVFTLIAWSFFQAGGQAGLNILMAETYPSAMRSTGIGWAGGVGRIGGIVGPLFGGLALASAFSLPATMTFVALPPLVVAALFIVLGRKVPLAPTTTVVPA